MLLSLIACRVGAMLAVLSTSTPAHGHEHGRAGEHLNESPTIPGEENLLALPAIGDLRLRIITPTILEVFLVTTKPPDARVSAWGFVGDDLTLRLPPASGFTVLCDGKK